MALVCVRQPNTKDRITKVVKVRQFLTLRLLVLVIAIVAIGSLKGPDPVFLQQIEGNSAKEFKLEFGVPLTHRLARTSADGFTINLVAGQFAQVRIEKEGDLALKITVLDADNQKIIDVQSRRYGTLRFPLVAKIAGPFHLSVRSLEVTESKYYGVALEELRPISANDEVHDNATRSLFEAERLRADWTEAGLNGSIEKYSHAITLWESIGHVHDAQDALENIGEVYSSLSQYRQALVYFNKALASSEANKDLLGQITALTNIGYAHANTGNNATALQFLKRALALSKSAKTSSSDQDRNIRARTLNNMGEVYYSSGTLKYALVLFKDALSVWKATAN